MKLTPFGRLLIVSALLSPLLAQAHPGHDGDHELVWEFDHLASHPLATIGCVAMLVAAGWGVWRLLQSRPVEKPQRISRR